MQVGVRRVKTVTTRRETRESRYQRSTAPTLDYVAAELPKNDLLATFTVGDGETRGSFDNKPLESNTQYDIYLSSTCTFQGTPIFTTQRGKWQDRDRLTRMQICISNNN